MCLALCLFPFILTVWSGWDCEKRERSDKNRSLLVCVLLGELIKFEVQGLSFGSIMLDPERAGGDIRIQGK